MKNFYLCFSIMFLSFQISYSQNEYYVATKVEELMHEEIFQQANGLGGIAAIKKDTLKIKRDENKFVNFETNKSSSDRVKLISNMELAILDKLFQFYYTDTIPDSIYLKNLPPDSIYFQKVKQVITKLNPKANLQASGSLAGFGVSQAELITAIADVVVERAKQELAKMYFDKWADNINSGITIYYASGNLYFSPQT